MNELQPVMPPGSESQPGGTNRKRRNGLILGCASIGIILLLAAAFLPAFVKAKQRAQSTACVGNIKQINLSAPLIAARTRRGTGRNSTRLRIFPTNSCCPERGNLTGWIRSYSVAQFTSMLALWMAVSIGDNFDGRSEWKRIRPTEVEVVVQQDEK
jgi:hypothetical protein